MSITDETLMAYLDGELDNAARASVEAAMVAEPELARRVARQRALREQLRATFDPTLTEPIPERLLAAARGGSKQASAGRVESFRRGAARPWAWPQWGALAASLILGVLIAPLLHRTPAPSPLQIDRTGVLASGVLAQALSQQLAGDQSTSAPVRIGISFRSQSGAYCRTFELLEPGAVAGVACRQRQSWRLQALAAAGASPSGAGAYQPAASHMPAAIERTVEGLIAGDALDAKAEAAARGRGWN
jgi:hypothetical protein